MATISAKRPPGERCRARGGRAPAGRWRSSERYDAARTQRIAWSEPRRPTAPQHHRLGTAVLREGSWRNSTNERLTHRPSATSQLHFREIRAVNHPTGAARASLRPRLRQDEIDGRAVLDGAEGHGHAAVVEPGELPLVAVDLVLAQPQGVAAKRHGGFFAAADARRNDRASPGRQHHLAVEHHGRPWVGRMDVARRQHRAPRRGDGEIAAARRAMHFDPVAIGDGDAVEADEAVVAPALDALRLLTVDDDADDADGDVQLGTDVGDVTAVIDDVRVGADLAIGRMDDAVLVDLGRGGRGADGSEAQGKHRTGQSWDRSPHLTPACSASARDRTHFPAVRRYAARAAQPAFTGSIKDNAPLPAGKA